MIAKLSALRKELGLAGIAAFLALAACAEFHVQFVRPLEQESARLDVALASRQNTSLPVPPRDMSAAAPPARAMELYELLRSGERIDESLGRLNGIAMASGVELRSAEYRLGDARYRLERYEISLPVQGTYAQIRLFLETAMRELPSLSLDRATLRRKASADKRIEAELVLTLHRLRP